MVNAKHITKSFCCVNKPFHSARTLSCFWYWQQSKLGQCQKQLNVMDILAILFKCACSARQNLGMMSPCCFPCIIIHLYYVRSTLTPFVLLTDKMLETCKVLHCFAQSKFLQLLGWERTGNKANKSHEELMTYADVLCLLCRFWSPQSHCTSQQPFRTPT